MSATDWTPSKSSLPLLEAAQRVIADADADGYRFTLRRVYYEMVAANVLPNTIASYRRLSELLNNARWAGYIDMDALDDLGRVVQVRVSWSSPSEAIASVADWYRSDWWRNSDHHLELWAEKAAVSSIVDPVADRYGVPFLTMRGYSSLTAIAEAARRWRRPAVVLYLGDHDPSGLDMDRDLQERLTRLGAHVQVKRIALTRDQIDDHGLPPQPSKSTDPRARGYIGVAESWELDALPAAVLAQLAEDAIADHLPDDFDDLQAEDEIHRRRIRRVATEHNFVEEER